MFNRGKKSVWHCEADLRPKSKSLEKKKIISNSNKIEISPSLILIYTHLFSSHENSYSNLGKMDT